MGKGNAVQEATAMKPGNASCRGTPGAGVVHSRTEGRVQPASGEKECGTGDTGGSGRAQIRQSLQDQGDKFRCYLRHDGNLLRLQSKQGIHN